jgi:hypothetical protein
MAGVDNDCHIATHHTRTQAMPVLTSDDERDVLDARALG